MILICFSLIYSSFLPDTITGMSCKPKSPFLISMSDTELNLRQVDLNSLIYVLLKFDK